MKDFRLSVNKQCIGLRLDVYLYKIFKEKKEPISRTFIKNLIQAGLVKSNLSDNVLKPHYKVRFNEIFDVQFPQRDAPGVLPENIPLDIIYEDRNLLVVNKPAGLVVHPGPGNKEHTLVNALLFSIKNLSDVNINRPGIVHRLDKDTSGLLVVSKDNATHLSLAEQFKNHTVKRKYVAIVEGKIEFDEGIIEMPIKRDKYNFKKMSVGFSKDSKYAKTTYKTLKRFDDSSFLELIPFTGRTHQLRVHLSFLGHPILGDKKYAKTKSLPRLYLHAKSLAFLHPMYNKFMEFDSDLPREFINFLNRKK